MLIHCSLTLQVPSRCFLMGQLTSSSRPAQTFGMVLTSTPSLAQTGEHLSHLMHSGAADKLKKETVCPLLTFLLVMLIKLFNRNSQVGYEHQPSLLIINCSNYSSVID